MTNLSCLCGQIQIRLEKRPEFINQCNCTLCRKTGARWSYFGPGEVVVEGTTNGCSRPDKKQPNAEVHFCPTCGSTTHFVLTETAIAKFGNTMVGVNMWLSDPQDLVGLELRFPDGEKWPGDGDFTYVREPLIIDANLKNERPSRADVR